MNIRVLRLNLFYKIFSKEFKNTQSGINEGYEAFTIE